jgi:hypothetical protein
VLPNSILMTVLGKKSNPRVVLGRLTKAKSVLSLSKKSYKIKKMIEIFFDFLKILLEGKKLKQ